MLSPRQLQELHGAITALLEATLAEDQDVCGFSSEARKERGSIEWKLIPDTKRRKIYGPYPYLRYWQNGHLKSQYLKGFQGAPPPDVLQRLEKLKASLAITQRAKSFDKST